MDDNSKSNITQLLDCFLKFNSLLLNTSWVKSSKVEDIKTVFKLGNFIEDSAKFLATQNALEQFIILHQCQAQVGNTQIDYLCASDYLLKAFFRYENVSEGNLDIAIRIYTSIYPKDRLQKVFSELIVSSQNLESLFQFSYFLPLKTMKKFEYYLHLCNWCKFHQKNSASVKSEIKRKLASHNLFNDLTQLLGILSLKDISNEEKLMQDVILDTILETMLDRSILSNSFWSTLLQEIDMDLLTCVCENYQTFLDSLFSFIVFLGSMMIKDYLWKSDPNQLLCSTITYYDLLIVIKYIGEINPSYLYEKISEAKNDTASAIWDEVKDELLLTNNKIFT